MFISAGRVDLAGSTLEIAEWLRAPLYLSNGTKYFACLESKAHTSSNIELVVSTFDSDFWDDLWRIEIDTNDEPGNTFLLFSLLQERGFQVLASESSINTFAKIHTTTVIVSAKEYIGDFDLTQRERLARARPELVEMQRELLIYFGDQIALNPDRSPTLKIRHLRTYRKLSEDLRSGSRFLLNRIGEHLADNKITITSRAMDHIQAVAGQEHLQYAAAVESKDRMIRLLFFGEAHPRSLYAQIIIDAEKREMLPLTYKMFYESGANIIRNTVRPTPAPLATKFISRASSRIIYPDQVQWLTIDITFSFPASNDHRSLQNSISNLDKLFKAKTSSKTADFFVLRRSWG